MLPLSWLEEAVYEMMVSVYRGFGKLMTKNNEEVSLFFACHK